MNIGDTKIDIIMAVILGILLYDWVKWLTINKFIPSIQWLWLKANLLWITIRYRNML